VLTPDSSRFWPAESYREGAAPPSFDKQYLRDWLEAVCIGGKPWNKKAPPPPLSDETASKTVQRYEAASAALLG
jgi:phosphoribosylaminoimidazole-succinocarboxamide synthase